MEHVKKKMLVEHEHLTRGKTEGNSEYSISQRKVTQTSG